MPVSLFLVPIVGAGTRSDPRRGKYSFVPGTVVRRGIIPYSHDHALGLIEAPAAYLADVASKLDVVWLAAEDDLTEQWQNVDLSGPLLSFTVDGGALGKPGIVQMSAVVDEEQLI